MHYIVVVIGASLQTRTKLPITNKEDIDRYLEGLRQQDVYKRQRYMSTPVPNEDNANTRKEFAKRAEELYEGLIKKEFEKILDTLSLIHISKEITSSGCRIFIFPL